MKNKFLNAANVGGNKDNPDIAAAKREIFSHVTCATNTQNVAHVFSACRASVAEKEGCLLCMMRLRSRVHVEAAGAVATSSREPQYHDARPPTARDTLDTVC